MKHLVEALLAVPAPLAYAVVAALTFGEAAVFIGFVLPAETAVVTAGVLASTGRISLPALLLVVVAAAIAGDTVGYEVGRHVGPRVLRSRLLRRHRARLDAARASLRDRGGWAVFMGRFTAFLRAVVPGLAGVSEMPYRRFLTYNAAGGLVWGAGVVLLGYGAGSSYARVEQLLGRTSAALIAVVAAVGLFVWWRRRRRLDRRGAGTGVADGVSVDPAPSGAAEGVLVVIPTYDEVENIGAVVRRVRVAVPAADILVVDDGSPDGTGMVADGMAADDPHVHVAHRERKDGLGAAYVAGLGWGIGRAYGILVEMDADGSHQPEQLPRLLSAIESGADLVLGSRWVPGGSVVNWPMHRALLSRAGNLYTRIALGVPVRDATGGYRAFRRPALQDLRLGEVDSQGYCFQVDLVRRAAWAGLSVTEVPITFVERVYGVSKMSGSIVAEALWRVTWWGLERRVGQVRRLVRPRTGERRRHVNVPG